MTNPSNHSSSTQPSSENDPIEKALAAIHSGPFRQVDLKLTDLFGRWQHTTVPVKTVGRGLFEEGIGFDGSSMRGWLGIHESDMQLRADASTLKIDPFASIPTASFICNVFDPISGQAYTRDPRYVLQKADNYLRSTGIADRSYFGPEAEFFLFDDVRYQVEPNSSFFRVDSVEAAWNSHAADDSGRNLGYQSQLKGGYFPTPPFDKQWHIRSEMSEILQGLGIDVEVHHHEVGAAGQGEIGIRFDTLLNSADNLLWFMYVIRNVAAKHGKAATFMPKPMFGDNGSGMHTHVSLWKEDSNLFYGSEYAGLSQTALHFIAGILHHAPSLVALTNPTLNSYRRLVPGYEAPVRLAYSSRNRSAAIRIPAYASSPKSKRIEFRTPDPSSNPYLAFAAILMAGLDGIENHLDPGSPIDKNIYNLPPEELAEIDQVPGSLEEALFSLEEDHQYLLKGDVFTPDLIETWITHKFEHEIEPARLQPSPFEYMLYFNG